MNINTDYLFSMLNNKIDDLKIDKYKKEQSRNNFLSKIKDAKKNIHLYGLNFPNYMTSPKDKIWDALKYLDINNVHVDIYIYIPSLKIRSEIGKLNIYKEEYQPKNLRRDIDKIINDHKKNFKNLNIKVIEYHKLYKIGLSAIDLGTTDSFVHLSQVKENELIKDAEYFDINYSVEAESTIIMIDTLLKRVRDE